MLSFDMSHSVQEIFIVTHSFRGLSKVSLSLQQKAKNDELIRLAEERKKEVERMKKEAEEKENSALRKQYEKERRARLQEVSSIEDSPFDPLNVEGRFTVHTLSLVLD